MHPYVSPFDIFINQREAQQRDEGWLGGVCGGGGGRICLLDCSNMRAREAKKEKESVCFVTFDVRRADPGAPRSSDQAGPLKGARAEERH